MNNEGSQNGGHTTAGASAAAWGGGGYGGAPPVFYGAPQGYYGAPVGPNPFNPPQPPTGQPTSAYTPPRTLHQAITAQVNENGGITGEKYKEACLSQASVRTEGYSNANADAWLEEKWNATEDAPEMGVWGFTTPGGGSILHATFGLCKYNGDSGGLIPNKVLGFCGDVDSAGNPPPFTTFPVTNTSRWHKVKESLLDANEMRDFYGPEGRRTKLRTTPRGTGETKMVPRLIWLPWEVATYVLELPRTVREVYVFVEELVESKEGLEKADMQLILDYCIAASYQKGSKASDSILALETQVVHSTFAEFIQFKQAALTKCIGGGDSTTPQGGGANNQGGASQQGTSIPMPPYPYQAGGLPPAMDPNFQAIVQAQVATTVASMGPLLDMMRDEMKKDREAGAAKSSGGTTLDDAKRYRLCGWSQLNGEFEKLQQIWVQYEGTKDMETLKGLFTDALAAWAGKQSELVIEENFNLSDEFMRMLVAVANYSQGEAVPFWRNFEKGFCPLNFLFEGKDVQLEKQEEEEDERTTEANRTREEARAIRKSKRDPRNPPATLPTFTIAVATLAGVISVHFGQACPLYKSLIQLHTILRSKQVTTKENLTPFVLATWWFAIMCDWRQYFDAKLTAKHFAPGAEPAFPTSMLASEFGNIQKGLAVQHGSFPEQWRFNRIDRKKPAANTTSTGGGGGGGGGSGNKRHNPTQDNENNKKRGSEWHNNNNNRGNFHQSNGWGNNNYGKFAGGQQGHQGGNNQNGWGRQQQQASPQFSTDQRLKHVHPWIRKAMEQYYQKFGPAVGFKRLCDAIAKVGDNKGGGSNDLPHLEGHISGGGRNALCYPYVLGQCPHGSRCNFTHVEGPQIPNDFASALLRTITGGVVWLVNNWTPGSDTSSNKQQGGRK